MLITAFSPSEPRHDESLTFLKELYRRGVTIEEPTTFLLELYAVLTRSPRQLHALGFMTEENAITIISYALDVDRVQGFLNWLRSALPNRVPTRGADLAYVYVAWSNKRPLVTLDGGLHQFRDAGIEVYYPGDVVSNWNAQTGR